MNFQRMPSFRRKSGERFELNNTTRGSSRGQSQIRSRSRSRSRGANGGGVLAHLAQLNDREVLQAVNEIRRKQQQEVASAVEETLYTSPSSSRYSSSSSSSPSSTSSSSREETNNTWGDNGSSAPYTIEIQNENGSTDSMCEDAIIISDASHEDPPVRPLSSRRTKQQQHQSHNYLYSSESATSTESMGHDDELGIEQFYKSSDEREFYERRRSKKKNQTPSSSLSNRSALQRSNSSFRKFQQYLPSIDTRSNLESSWSYLEENNPLSSHRQESFAAFCVDGFSCVGNSQKYTIMDTSPVHGKKIRSTKSSSNESRLNLIDEFLLQKIRSKESSLMDESATFEEPEEDTVDDTITRNHTSARLVEYNDKRHDSQHRRNSMSKQQQQQLHKRSVERATPANSGCRNVFEEFIDRLAGLDEDDDEDTVEVGLRLVQSVSRSRKRSPDASDSKNTFDTDEDESKLTYDLNTVSDGSTYYTYDDTATSNQYTLSADYTQDETYTTATTRTTGGNGDGGDSYSRYTNNENDATYGTTKTNKDDDYTMSTNGGRYTTTTYEDTADTATATNTEQHTTTTTGDYTYSNYTASTAGGNTGTTMTRTTMTGANSTNIASQGSTISRQLPSPAGTYQTHSPLHEDEDDDDDRTRSSSRSAVSSFSTSY